MITVSGGISVKKSFYDFVVNDIEGKPFDFSTLKGKKVLIVNTASKCGFTPQYEQLQQLYENWGGDKFVIIGFPANNFKSYGARHKFRNRTVLPNELWCFFPMMSKISVKGDDMHPLYKWLTSKSENGVMDSEVHWNFQKYFIDENGKLVDMVESR